MKFWQLCIVVLLLTSIGPIHGNTGLDLVTSLILLLQAIPRPDSFWPSSVGAWIGFIGGTVSVVIIAYDRITGRASNWRDVKRDIQELAERVTKEEAATKNVGDSLRSMDQLLTGINHELRGVAGDNGIRQTVRKIGESVEKIIIRNQKMDLKAAVFEQILKQTSYNGPERREAVREMRNLFQAEEEVKG